MQPVGSCGFFTQSVEELLFLFYQLLSRPRAARTLFPLFRSLLVMGSFLFLGVYYGVSQGRRKQEGNLPHLPRSSCRDPSFSALRMSHITPTAGATPEPQTRPYSARSALRCALAASTYRPPEVVVPGGRNLEGGGLCQNPGPPGEKRAPTAAMFRHPGPASPYLPRSQTHAVVRPRR